MLETIDTIYESYIEQVEDGIASPVLQVNSNFDGPIVELDIPCAIVICDGALEFSLCDLRGVDFSQVGRLRLEQCQITGAILPSRRELDRCVADDLSRKPNPPQSVN